ncbi:MAG: Kae1-associated serine/threonine protein kinase [Nanoarchaeota archaeon]|nr:Kae1-associated serine/threonine protein kinase [Nanoarchaeota archaeon]
MNKLIAQGAEAKIFLSDEIILKDRIPKSYRHPQLDNQIRTRRTKSEAKILTKALEAGASVPKVLNTEKFSIQIEYIKGDRLSETLNNYNEKLQFKIMRQLGKQTALLHENNIIHGDLTTSNTIWKDEKVFIIDFGLGFISTKLEDKAVDLHLIKQALEAKHYQNHEDLFEEFKKGYIWPDSKKIIERLEVVERRGRYKH